MLPTYVLGWLNVQATIERHVARILASHAITITRMREATVLTIATMAYLSHKLSSHSLPLQLELVSRYAVHYQFLFHFFISQLFRVPVHVIDTRDVPKTFPSLIACYELFYFLVTPNCASLNSLFSSTHSLLRPPFCLSWFILESDWG